MGYAASPWYVAIDTRHGWSSYRNTDYTLLIISSNGLSRLSEDCWLLILERLSSCDVISLCATSHSLRAASEAFLYHRISINWNNPPFERVVALFSAIIARPYLAACIQHVSFLPTKLEDPSPNGEMWYPPEVQQGDLKSSACQKVVSVTKQIISDSQIPSSADWIQAIEDGDIYAFVALFISQLHNLRTLRLDYSFVRDFGWPGRMMKHALSRTQTGMSRFSHLHDVEYGSNAPRPAGYEDAYNDILNMEGFPPCNADQFAGWFYLPSLRSLEIWLQNFDDALAGFASRQIQMHLERLVLVHVSTEEQVSRLLHFIGPVRSLHLGLVYHSFRVPRLEPLSQADALIQALMPMKDTLKHLSIGLEFHPIKSSCLPDTWNDETSKRGLGLFQGVLKDFVVMESVEIPWMMLCGLHPSPSQDIASLLPKNLRSLCLRSDLWLVLDYRRSNHAICHLIKAIQSSLPSLETSVSNLQVLLMKFFEYRYTHIRLIHQENFSELVSSCSERGMDLGLSVIAEGLHSGTWTWSRPLKEWEGKGDKRKPFEWKKVGATY